MMLNLLQDFLRPIVTPFELYLSLSAEPSWPGNYILDFERVIELQTTTPADHGMSKINKSSHLYASLLLVRPVAEGNEDEADQPMFSLVTGKYRHAKRYGQGTFLPTLHCYPINSIYCIITLLKTTSHHCHQAIVQQLCSAILKMHSHACLIAQAVGCCATTSYFHWDGVNPYPGEFLKQRTFKGLEQRLGEDVPSILEQGRTGIARGYQDDHLSTESTPG